MAIVTKQPGETVTVAGQLTHTGPAVLASIIPLIVDPVTGAARITSAGTSLNVLLDTVLMAYAWGPLPFLIQPGDENTNEWTLRLELSVSGVILATLSIPNAISVPALAAQLALSSVLAAPNAGPPGTAITATIAFQHAGPADATNIVGLTIRNQDLGFAQLTGVFSVPVALDSVLTTYTVTIPFIIDLAATPGIYDFLIDIGPSGAPIRFVAPAVLTVATPAPPPTTFDIPLASVTIV